MQAQELEKHIGEFYDAVEMGDFVRAIGREKEVEQFVGLFSSMQPDMCRMLLDKLGKSQVCIGNFDQAVKSFQQSLKLAQQMGDIKEICRAYANLGIAYISTGDTAKAKMMHEESLQLAIRTKDQNLIGSAQSHLGNVFQAQGQFARALEAHKAHLQAARLGNDGGGQALALNNMANANLSLGNFEEALQFFQERLHIAMKSGDSHGESKAYNGMGLAFFSLGQFAKAIEMHSRSMRKAQEVSDASGQCSAYNNIGIVFEATGQHIIAQKMYENSLALAIECGDLIACGRAHGNIGNIHHARGRHDLARDQHTKALHCAMETGDLAAQGRACGGLGNALSALNMHTEAVVMHTQDLAAAEQTGDKSAQASAAINLAIAHRHLQQYDAAVALLRRATLLASETGARQAQLQASLNLGLVLMDVEQLESAEQHLMESLQYCESMHADLHGRDDDRVALSDLQRECYVYAQRLFLRLGRTGDALAVAERGKARALLELQRGWRRDGPLPATASIAVAGGGGHGNVMDTKGRQTAAAGEGGGQTGAGGGAGSGQNVEKGHAAVTWAQVAGMLREEGATLVEYSLIDDDTLVVWLTAPRDTGQTGDGPGDGPSYGSPLSREIHIGEVLRRAVDLPLPAALEVLRCAVGGSGRTRGGAYAANETDGDDDDDDGPTDEDKANWAGAVQELEDRLLAVALWESDAEAAAAGSGTAAMAGKTADPAGERWQGRQHGGGDAGQGTGHYGGSTSAAAAGTVSRPAHATDATTAGPAPEGHRRRLWELPELSGVAGLCSEEDFLEQSAAAVQQRQDVCAWLDRTFLPPHLSTPSTLSGADCSMQDAPASGQPASRHSGCSGQPPLAAGGEDVAAAEGRGPGAGGTVAMREAVEAVKGKVVGWDGLRRAAARDEAFLREECGVVDAQARRRLREAVAALFDQEKLLRVFYDLLIQPVDDMLAQFAMAAPTKAGLGEVLIVPELELFTVPWAALMGPDGRYLIERYSVRLAPSLLVAQQAALGTGGDRSHSGRKAAAGGGSSADSGMLVVGNPWPLGEHVVRFGELPAAKEEAQDVAEALNVRPLLRGRATRAAVLAGLRGAHWAHLACHGWLERRALLLARSPPAAGPGAAYGDGGSGKASVRDGAGSGGGGGWSSAAQRAQGGGAVPAAAAAGSGDDGLLTAAELVAGAVRLRAGSTVVLSACNSGLGRVRADGVVGVARAFLAAGAGAAVVSLWCVLDKSTRLLMDPVYWAVCRGYAVPDALRFAMVMMAKHGEDYALPRSWAGFVVVGAATVLRGEESGS